MRHSQRLGLAAVVFAACAGLACHKDRPPGVSRDVDALVKMLKLPGRPIEVWWEETPVGVPGWIGPTDYDLFAVLHFDPATVAALTKCCPPLPGSPTLISAIDDRPWLPPPVRAAIRPFDEYTRAIRGTKYAAEPLLRWPFASGALIVIEGSAYVLIGARTA